MLILTRKPGESLYIGDNIKITIIEIKGHQIRVGIDAPTELRIYREEIYLQILEENKKAAEGAMASDTGLEGLTQVWKDRPPSKPTGSRTGLTSAGSSALKTQPAPQVVIKRKKKRPGELEDESADKTVDKEDSDE